MLQSQSFSALEGAFEKWAAANFYAGSAHTKDDDGLNSTVRNIWLKASGSSASPYDFADMAAPRQVQMDSIDESKVSSCVGDCAVFRVLWCKFKVA